jgi:hypothetical protein
MFSNEEKYESSAYKSIMKFILSSINQSTVWLIIFIIIILKIFLVSLWFLTRFGVYAGICSLLCNINVILIFLTCLKTQKLQNNYVHVAKKRSLEFKKCAANFKNDFEFSLMLMEKSLNSIVDKIQN